VNWDSILFILRGLLVVVLVVVLVAACWRGVRQWYYREFLREFCYYWPLLLLLLLPLGLMLGVVLAGYGPTYLFFHDDPIKALVVGITVVVCCAQTLLVAYLLWLRDLREEGRFDQSFLTFWSFAWRILASLVATGVLAWAVIEGGGRIMHVLGSPILAEGSATEADLAEKPAEIGAADSPAETYTTDPLASELCPIMAVIVGAILAVVVLFWQGRWLRPKMAWVSEWFLDWAHQPAQEHAGTALFRIAVGFALCVVGAWVWVFVELCRADTQGWWPYWGPMGLVLLGLVVTGSALVSAIDLRRREPAAPSNRRLLIHQWLFWGAALANLCVSFAGVTYCVSQFSWGIVAGLIAATVCAVILGACLAGLFPRYWAAGWLVLTRPLEAMHKEERDHVAWSLVCLALPLALLLVLWLVPRIASPAPLALAALSGIVVLYGWFAYVVRRSFVLLVGLLLLVVLFSHLQPYKMRFSDLSDYYTPPDRAGNGIADLQQLVREEWKRQQEFEGNLKQYLDNEPDLEELVKLQEAISRGDDPTPVQISAVLSVRKRWREVADLPLPLEIADLVARVKRLHDNLADTMKQQWERMEKRNRFRPPRIPPRLVTRDTLPRLKQTLGIQPGPADGSEPDLGLLMPEALRVHSSTYKGTPSGQKPTLIVIAVSGGGIRSALWTFVVLSELEQAFAAEGIDFPSHVRLITGASGGMVGAAYYVATLPHPDERPPTLLTPEALEARGEVLREQRGRLSSDFLTPLVEQTVLGDIPGWLSPWPQKYDRGRALEEAWAEHLKDPRDRNGPGALEKTFDKLIVHERAGWLPSLVFTPTLIEDGRRILVSNLDLREPLSNDGTVLHAKDVLYPDNHSLEALEMFRLFPSRGRHRAAQATLRLATAARMSASFPYFSPAVSLPTRPRRRVVDAGYYDNYGVGLAAAWLFSDSSQEWVRRNFNRILFIQIRDGLTEDERQLTRVIPDSTTSLTRSGEELTSPPEGLYNAAFASSSFRNDGQLELLEKFDELSRDRALLETTFRRFSMDPNLLQDRLGVLNRARLDQVRQVAATHALVASPPAAPCLPLGAIGMLGAIGHGLIPGWSDPPLPGAYERASRRPRRLDTGQSKQNVWDWPFLVANFELDRPASTSWYLSNKEKREIAGRAAVKLKAKIRAVLLWWKFPYEER
jgi:hypothetical protein